MTTFDWGECLAALNLVVKPVFDMVVNRELAAAARDAGDYSLALILTSLDQDATWHRDWTRQLVRDCVDHEGRQALSAWIKEWRGPTEDAMAPIVSALGSESRWPAIHEAHDDYLHLCGLESR
jgi:toluene monooxygenase system protein E